MNALLLVGGPLLILGIIQFVFGVFCLAKNEKKNIAVIPASLSALVSGFYCATIALSYIRASMSLDYALYYRMAWAAWLLAPLFLQILIAIDPKPRKSERIAVWFLWAFW